jgi:hypothetical protein
VDICFTLLGIRAHSRPESMSHENADAIMFGNTTASIDTTNTCLQAKAQSQSGAAQGLYYLKRVDAIFDDFSHFKSVDAISGLTHPCLEAVTDIKRLHIRSTDDLKRIVQTKLGLFFCGLCLEHRQVFTSEQALYTREELREHQAKGDQSGPLKDANFKGHPKCEYAMFLLEPCHLLWQVLGHGCW